MDRIAEGLSEKAIQGIMYVEGKYIDTEFEYVHLNRLITRIDLTTINDDGMIEFVELKRISDSRLLKKDISLKNEEIRKQIDDYNSFIKGHKDEIIQYYKQLQQILKKVGVNNPLCNIAITDIKPSVYLYFAGYAGRQRTCLPVDALNEQCGLCRWRCDTDRLRHSEYVRRCYRE